VTFKPPSHPFPPTPPALVQVISDIRPEPELQEDYIERNPVTTTVQCVPEQSEHEARPRAHPSNGRNGNSSGDDIIF
jgi:hypothetical protein